MGTFPLCYELRCVGDIMGAMCTNKQTNKQYVHWYILCSQYCGEVCPVHLALSLFGSSIKFFTVTSIIFVVIELIVLNYSLHIFTYRLRILVVILSGLPVLNLHDLQL